MQGDLYRAKLKEQAMDKGHQRERHHSVSHLLSSVDDMRIHDAIENDNRFSNYDNVNFKLFQVKIILKIIITFKKIVFFIFGSDHFVISCIDWYKNITV